VTPMMESDLRLHLGKQTRGKLKSLDITALNRLDAESHLDALVEDSPSGVIFDERIENR